MTTSTLDIQRRLLSLGYPVGPLDGLPGRITTAAIKAFQKQSRLVADGIVGAMTITALNKAAQHASDVTPLSDDVEPPWIENLRPYIGLQEKRDNKKLRDYLDSDGETVGDPAKIPWCGDLVQTAIALTLPNEPLPGNPYYALNWAAWARPVPDGMVPKGAVGTKRRDGGGHVFFVIGQDDTYLHTVAGNTSNSIGIALVRKADLYGQLRCPTTYPLPTKSMPFTTIDATINATEA